MTNQKAKDKLSYWSKKLNNFNKARHLRRRSLRDIESDEEQRFLASIKRP